MKSGEQLAPIKGQRSSRPPLLYRCIESPDVTPHLFEREGELLVATCHDSRCAQGPTKEIDRLPEGMPGLLGVVLGPEEGKQRVTALETAGRREGEIAEEGCTAGLRQNRTDGCAVGRGQLQGPQSTQFDHCRASRRGVTQW